MVVWHALTLEISLMNIHTTVYAQMAKGRKTFKYSEMYVLCDLNLRVKSGKTSVV